jgi:hypothetical protein
MTRKQKALTRVDRVDPNDPEALRQWAIGICRGRTIEEVAAPLGITPTMDSLLRFLTKGLSANSERAVREICERELKG